MNEHDKLITICASTCLVIVGIILVGLIFLVLTEILGSVLMMIMFVASIVSLSVLSCLLHRLFL